MFNKNLILNPWKFGFILIFFSNIVFHASPSFLLLFLLAGIFLYIYVFLFYLFNDYASAYSMDLLNKNLSLISQLTFGVRDVLLLVEKFGDLGFLYRRLLDLWSVSLPNYKCLAFGNDTNYMFLVISGYYDFARGKHLSSHRSGPFYRK